MGALEGDELPQDERDGGGEERQRDWPSATTGQVAEHQHGDRRIAEEMSGWLRPQPTLSARDGGPAPGARPIEVGVQRDDADEQQRRRRGMRQPHAQERLKASGK